MVNESEMPVGNPKTVGFSNALAVQVGHLTMVLFGLCVPLFWYAETFPRIWLIGNAVGISLLLFPLHWLIGFMLKSNEYRAIGIWVYSLEAAVSVSLATVVASGSIMS